jgi:hypothetical protein
MNLLREAFEVQGSFSQIKTVRAHDLGVTYLRWSVMMEKFGARSPAFGAIRAESIHGD